MPAAWLPPVAASSVTASPVSIAIGEPDLDDTSSTRLETTSSPPHAADTRTSAAVFVPLTTWGTFVPSMWRYALVTESVKSL